MRSFGSVRCRSTTRPCGRPVAPAPGRKAARFLPHVVSAALLALPGAGPAHAGLITLDVCPNGTTSNLNLYGTTLGVVSGTTVATWNPDKTSYRDYQFKLQTVTGTTSFDEFAVRLSAQRRNSTPTQNTLRATLWTGTIQPNPVLADSLVTVTIPNSSIPTSGYTSVLLSGVTFPSQTIDTTPSTFYFRVWAQGDGSNSGFQTKMVNTKFELPQVTMQETVPGDIDGYIAVDQDEDGDFEPSQPGNDYYDFISYSTGVPEIDPSGIPGVAALVAGALACLERRSKRRA